MLFFDHILSFILKKKLLLHRRKFEFDHFLKKLCTLSFKLIVKKKEKDLSDQIS